jgi:hypothetical protein
MRRNGSYATRQPGSWVHVELTDITEQLDRGLDSPVVIVISQQRVSEEELVISTGLESGEGTYTRVVSTHIPVCDGVTVDDLFPDHILSGFCSLFLVNPARQLRTDVPKPVSLPFRLDPMIMIDKTVLAFSIGQSLCMPGD